MVRELQSSLFIHDEEVTSVFQTLGTNENDLSYSLGYVLSKSPNLLKKVIRKVYAKKIKFQDIVIKLQENGEDNGYTDFEICVDNKFLFVIEAKRGWILPSIKQLKRYLKRFRGFSNKKRAFIVLSDCKKEYFDSVYKDSIYNTPIKSIAWADIISLITEVYPSASDNEKFFLRELEKYLREVVIMENQEVS